jgi:hypothetical protein
VLLEEAGVSQTSGGARGWAAVSPWRDAAVAQAEPFVGFDLWHGRCPWLVAFVHGGVQQPQFAPRTSSSMDSVEGIAKKLGC